MGIWIVGASDQLFIRAPSTETKFSKIKEVNSKTPFFMIGPFWTHHSICPNIGF